MATSGALSTSNTYVKYTISINQNSQSISDNTSNVTVSVRFYRTNTGYTTYGTGTVYCKINGTTYSASVTPSDKITNSGIILFSKNLNIGHESDGSKTLTCSAWISHNAPLTSSEQSYSQTLSTIPRKSELSVGNGTLDSSQTLTVTRKSSSFTHTIVAVCGSASSTVCTKSGSTSLSFTPPISWASQNGSSIYLTVTYTITTYNGNTNIGSNQYSVTCTIPSTVKPSCSINVTDSTGYLTEYGSYIKSKSKLNISITSTLAYGSAISTYRTNVEGVSYNSSSFITEQIKTAGTLTINTSVTDKRGRSGTASIPITVIDYSDPAIPILKVKRCDIDGTENNQGEYVKVIFSATVTSLNNQNSVTHLLQYKKSSESVWSTADTSNLDGAYTISESDIIITADSGSSYDIRLTVTDDFGSTSKTTVVSTAFTLMHFKDDGTGIGIGKVAESSHVLDIGILTKLSGGMLYPALEIGTDFNTLYTPNMYSLKSIQVSEYSNCPLESGTATLLIESCGETGQVRQIIKVCNKTRPLIYERYYYQHSWGEWINVQQITPNTQINVGGGFSYPSLPANTDFNDINVPNKYCLSSISSYINIPSISGLSDASGMLEVEPAGVNGQIHQIFSLCHKTTPFKYERYYYQDTWGDWIQMS